MACFPTSFSLVRCRRYVDYPITDVLQMMGRAGRPQYDKHGVAVVMVHEPKKSFYKKFIYEPFPVESSLPAQLADHLNAEAAGGTIRSRQDAVDYLTWTFFIRRLLQNPSYYGLESTEQEDVSQFLSELVGEALGVLQEAGCLEIDDEGAVESTANGRIASFYYLRHATMAGFTESLGPGMGVEDMLGALCSAAEYAELPVRHNEDKLNAGMAGQVRFPPDMRTVGECAIEASRYFILQGVLLRCAAQLQPLPARPEACICNFFSYFDSSVLSTTVFCSRHFLFAPCPMQMILIPRPRCCCKPTWTASPSPSPTMSPTPRPSWTTQSASCRPL